MKRIISFLIFTLSFLTASAQMLEPVKFTTSLNADKTGEGEILFKGTIAKGWHVYSTNLGSGGPIEASLSVNKLDGVELVGKLKAKGKEISAYDKLFEMTLRYFEGSVVFVQKVRFTKPHYSIDTYLEYGACSNMNCLPPSQVEFKKNGKSIAVAGENNHAYDEKQSQAQLETVTPVTKDSQAYDYPQPSAQLKTDTLTLWQPAIKELQALSADAPATSRSLWYIFIMGLLGGFLAILMPCIWPIIPMTVSFFLHQHKSKAQGIRDAITYGISIIVIYVGLGLAITLIFGGNKLNELSTNAIFNIFLFLLLIVFAVSFFGWFEVKLPDRWGNSVDSKASRTSGLLSIFLMAFTLALVSFSCTAPIIGLLLAEMSTTGNILGPVTGMFGFALALALPFTIFAMFPTWMKQLPKSGSWMTKIQISLGFIELAFALKFLSVADLAYGWHILDREVFLSLWVVIFAALGAYLVGWLKFPADEIGGDSHKPMPVPAIMLGLGSFAFAVYMIPGLWGAPCKAVSAFAPPLYTQDFNLNKNEVRAQYTNYEAGMAAAKAAGKPVLLDFTGYGCVNCRKIEAKVWTDADVAKRLQSDYVLISLFVDDKTALAEPIEVEENGQKRTLRTLGDKWSYLQRHKFGANAQPFYVAVSPDGKPLMPAMGYDESVGNYLNFLDGGIKKYEATK